VTSAATPLHQLRPPRRPAWAGRNYGLLTAAAFAVLEAGGDGGDVGLVAASRTLPLVLFLLIGGAVADRLPRHRVMVAANALNCPLAGRLRRPRPHRGTRLWQMMLLTARGGAA
jgi:MFS family permease